MSSLQLFDKFVKGALSPLREGFTSDLFNSLDVLRDQYSIYEKNGKYVVEVAIAGLSSEEVKVSVDKEHKLLKISAKKTEEAEESEGEIIWHHKGNMNRNFSLYLPDTVVMESVNAEFSEGQLRVSFDMKNLEEIEKERRIEVPIIKNKA